MLCIISSALAFKASISRRTIRYTDESPHKLQHHADEIWTNQRLNLSNQLSFIFPPLRPHDKSTCPTHRKEPHYDKWVVTCKFSLWGKSCHPSHKKAMEDEAHLCSVGGENEAAEILCNKIPQPPYPPQNGVLKVHFVPQHSVCGGVKINSTSATDADWGNDGGVAVSVISPHAIYQGRTTQLPRQHGKWENSQSCSNLT